MWMKQNTIMSTEGWMYYNKLEINHSHYYKPEWFYAWFKNVLIDSIFFYYAELCSFFWRNLEYRLITFVSGYLQFDEQNYKAKRQSCICA
jgi:hypothetical protein